MDPQDEQIRELVKHILEIDDVADTLDDTRSRLELGRRTGLVERLGYWELVDILGNAYLDLEKIQKAFTRLLAALGISTEMPGGKS